jgi:hypothetical protein
MAKVSDLKNETDAARRNLGYEFFKVTHFFGVAVFVVTFFWHCDYTLTSW